MEEGENDTTTGEYSQRQQQHQKNKMTDNGSNTEGVDEVERQEEVAASSSSSSSGSTTGSKLEPEGSVSATTNLDVLVDAIKIMDDRIDENRSASNMDSIYDNIECNDQENHANAEQEEAPVSPPRQALVKSANELSAKVMDDQVILLRQSKLDLSPNFDEKKDVSVAEAAMDEKKDISVTEAAMDRTTASFNAVESDIAAGQDADTISEASLEANNTQLGGELFNGAVNQSMAQSSVSNNASTGSKRLMDASGICSLDIGTKDDSIVDPNETHCQKDPPDVTTTILEEQLKTSMEEAAMPAKEMVTMPEIPRSNDLTLETLIEEERNLQPEAIISPSGSVDMASSNSQLQRDLLLANKDKEGFGLLARGESLKVVQPQQEQQYHQQEQHELLKLQQQQNQNQEDDSSLLPRIPREPDAMHRRKESLVSATTSRRNSERRENMTPQADFDDEMNHTIDDTSWRPSHVSYPTSPLGLPAPQALAFNGGGYLVVPHHQPQPPHAFIAQPPMLHHQSSFNSQHSQLLGRPSYGYQPMHAVPPTMPSPQPSAPGGKRKIKLKLQEEILARPSHARRKSFFFGARSSRKLLSTPEPILETEQMNEVDRGTITVSWFEGTSSMELQDHVNRSVSRKLKLDDDKILDDVRILDTKVDPPEEIVLCPYIPDGSEFVLRYKLKPVSGRVASPTFYGPPDSPSAAPSPYPSNGNLGSLDASQLAMLRKQLDDVQGGETRRTNKYRGSSRRSHLSPLKPMSVNGEAAGKEGAKDESTNTDNKGSPDCDASDVDNESETNTYQPESSVDAKLRQITELLLKDRQKAQQQRYEPVGKRQVLFVLANYFVLFVAFITISAEIQARAPSWVSWIERQLEDVQNCSADSEALFNCISNGEFAGLFATVILWLSRSATTKRIFLFGFDSPKKLWTVVYESLVGAFCWGCSYMFIRRGMNPDTRPNFVQKYWKDAMYGSLAGFNATFMKSVLKNLIPQEAVEEAFNDRQLKILSWLPTFS